MPEASDIRQVEITGSGIRLGQLLKFADLIEIGSEAKEVIADGSVRVNGDVELRRGRQLERGDVVTLGSGPSAESVRLI
ncbi:RNA-binding S4 domain-containing protein [Nakamurella antarctica]|uniref:RNA-binding S4 domain-containing protein n=1 Tax=Nakamurella antarctica TaxID=1902245 RepID=UPI001EF0B4C1|nr:RNA-binding S4 domain-containing protein [Nakamurella antarctica]